MTAQKRCGRFTGWLVVALSFLLPAAVLAAGQEPVVIENETGVYYTIRKGDTLWDLSERFSDSPWQWPDLWEENDQITNPHWIYPGERIRLFRKQDLEKVVRMPEPSERTQPETAVTGVPEKERPYFLYTKIDAVGFVRKDPLVTSGTVVQVRGGHELISTGDVVYIDPNPDAPAMAIGERYTIYRNRRWIGEVKKELEKYGVQYLLCGVAEIVDKEGDVTVGRIVESYRAIHVEDRLIPYSPRSARVYLAESPEGVQGRIFLAEEHQENIGAGHIVFIDQGANDGIRRGQVYSIYYQERDLRKPHEPHVQAMDSFAVGELLVLHTEATTATCLVVDSSQELKPQAMVGNLE